MAERNVGMDPGLVAAQSALVGSHSMTLASLADEIGQTGEASRWPGMFGLLPGNIVMTQASIWLAESAASDVRAAAASATELIGRLSAGMAEQIEASSAGEGYRDGKMGVAQADGLYARAIHDPDALVGMTPQYIAAWWDRLTPQQRLDFASDHPEIAGNTNGIPFDVRVEANRLNAERVLLAGGTLSTDQRIYLEMVSGIEVDANGIATPQAGEPTKKLISFDPEADRIIEMIGEITPETKNLVTYVPGTTADLDGFYGGGTQQIGQNLVATALSRDTVAFVYKDSPFPTFDPDGVYNSSWAATVGMPYYDFSTALDLENVYGAATTSIEHSFGSSAGGYAETQGTQFDNRIVLAGIGMGDDWKANPSTNYYSFTGPDDVIRLAREKGSDDLNLGYPISPTAENGFTELGTGFADAPPTAVPGQAIKNLVEGVGQHTRVSGVEDNRETLSQILSILEKSK